MTQTAERKSHEIVAQYRVSMKSNQNLVIWQIASESGHTYNVSMLDGRISGCQDEEGNPCKGYFYRHTCHHCQLAQQKEEERTEAAQLSAKITRRIAQIDARLAKVTELGSCDTCGRMVKPGITTCARCLGY